MLEKNIDMTKLSPRLIICALLFLVGVKIISSMPMPFVWSISSINLLSIIFLKASGTVKSPWWWAIPLFNEVLALSFVWVFEWYSGFAGTLL